MTDLVAELRQKLTLEGSEAIQNSAQNFFKEEIQCYGVRTPIVKALARARHREIDSLSKKEVFALCETLWKSGILEESLVACDWSLRKKNQFEEADFSLFERWIFRYVHNWASCDTFCNHTVGEFLFRFPSYANRLLAWAKEENRWVRRAAAVSLILPAREGKFMETILRIATCMLEDKDDLVQKGYGWMLKVACRHHEKTVFDFVMEHRKQMPRTALRYAIEKMSPHLKAMAMGR